MLAWPPFDAPGAAGLPKKVVSLQRPKWQGPQRRNCGSRSRPRPKGASAHVGFFPAGGASAVSSLGRFCPVTVALFTPPPGTCRNTPTRWTSQQVGQTPQGAQEESMTHGVNPMPRARPSPALVPRHRLASRLLAPQAAAHRAVRWCYLWFGLGALQPHQLGFPCRCPLLRPAFELPVKARNNRPLSVV